MTTAVSTERFVCSWCGQLAFGGPIESVRVMAGKQITLTLCVNCNRPCRVDGCCNAAEIQGLCQRCWIEGVR